MVYILRAANLTLLVQLLLIHDFITQFSGGQCSEGWQAEAHWCRACPVLDDGGEKPYQADLSHLQPEDNHASGCALNPSFAWRRNMQPL